MSVPDPTALGAEMLALMHELWDHPRSLTGDGVRRTLAGLGGHVAVEMHEVPTGVHLYDWTVPEEWTLRRAWIDGPDGRRIADTAEGALHVVGYSEPGRHTLPLAELRGHLHTLPDYPDRVPFRTSYWKRGWGFCVSEHTARSLVEGDYEVVIDADLAPGSLTYGEAVLPGQGGGEVLISTPVCHPGLANDNLSGVALLAVLARVLSTQASRWHTYRFLWSPATLGPLAWLAANEADLGKLVAGLSPMCVGDSGPFTYKASRRGDTLVDRAARLALARSGAEHRLLDFVPWGGDERQFCSPGFDLPVGALMRTPPGHYPENHTSADDLDFVTEEALGESCRMYLDVIELIEADRRFLSTCPKGEPQLGRRELTNRMGGQKGDDHEMAMFWNLSMADGEHSLLDATERSGLPVATIRDAAEALVGAELLRPAETRPRPVETTGGDAEAA